MLFSRVLKHMILPHYGYSAVAAALMLAACKETSDTQAARQVSTPTSEKEDRTAVQQKLDSHLVMALKKSRGEPPFDKPTSFDPDLAVDGEGKVTVDITATVTPALLDRIRSAGGQVINHFEAMNAVRARVPLLQVEALAALPEVRFISPAAQATTNSPAAATGGNLSPQTSSSPRSDTPANP